MKMTKTFVSVFLATFIIGYISVLPTVEPAEIQVAEQLSNINVAQPESSKVEEKEDLQIVEEIGNWESDEIYPHKIKLLETGEGFHGDEVDARNGETWLGLFKENNNYFLRPTKITVRRVEDNIYDGEYKNQKTGKSVSIKNKSEPIFLLKNADKLKPGKINSLFQGLTWKEALKIEPEGLPDQLLTYLREDFAQQFEIGGKNYQLRVMEAKNPNGERISVLTLNLGIERQILHTASYGFVGKLFWVGDLDRDNKPDFFLDLYVHDNVSNTVLFLSSEAEKGKLVKEVAHFWTSGC